MTVNGNPTALAARLSTGSLSTREGDARLGTRERWQQNGDSTLSAAALNPSSVAIIGASDNPNKIGGRPLLFLTRFGFKGRIYPINPNRQEVQGFERLSRHVVRCRKFRTWWSWRRRNHVRGRSTTAPPAASARSSSWRRDTEKRTTPAGSPPSGAWSSGARVAGMRLIGPNSQGLANFGTGAIASFSTMFLEVEPADGPVGIISQSGMMSTAPYGLLRQSGIGVRHAHATGNDSDVTLAELALAVVQDPEVRLLLLYIESIRDPEMLARAAALARERDIPIVAVKAGRTARGQAAARSHTGALASEDRVVNAFFSATASGERATYTNWSVPLAPISKGGAPEQPAGRGQQLWRELCHGGGYRS